MVGVYRNAVEGYDVTKEGYLLGVELAFLCFAVDSICKEFLEDKVNMGDIFLQVPLVYTKMSSR